MSPDLVQLVAGAAGSLMLLLLNDVRQTLRDIRNELRETQAALRAHELALATLRQKCIDRHEVTA